MRQETDFGRGSSLLHLRRRARHWGGKAALRPEPGSRFTKHFTSDHNLSSPLENHVIIDVPTSGASLPISIPTCTVLRQRRRRVRPRRLPGDDLDKDATRRDRDRRTCRVVDDAARLLLYARPQLPAHASPEAFAAAAGKQAVPKRFGSRTSPPTSSSTAGSDSWASSGCSSEGIPWRNQGSGLGQGSS